MALNTTVVGGKESTDSQTDYCSDVLVGTGVVTKAPIDVFKTCLVFVFPAMGGLLFGKGLCRRRSYVKSLRDLCSHK